ncbi:unnamed protein product [Ostreobium quekettii]|uniref:Lipase maturation factor 2 n=1 Tax=Ostreobium quekettii TaxID=121088 RepID=A0A8S1J5A6_9CHLO|nr:unnamed protein product [Ostreobium quekettii]
MRHPTVMWFHLPFGLHADVALDIVSLLGMVLSLAASVGFGNQVVVFGMWLSYLSIVHVGQTFLSFQWDILISEVGWVSVWLSRPPGQLPAAEPPTSAVLLLRWILFKLMFMSGVVKIQALCPTWLALTACHYHFATQCIPTPIAWYFHQLPDIVLKLMVSISYIVEIPATFLILVPLRPIRLFAAALQILFQVAIILTGNYTFFNILTIALCLSLFDDTVWRGTTRPNARRVGAKSAPTPGTHSDVLMDGQPKSRKSAVRRQKKISDRPRLISKPDAAAGQALPENCSVEEDKGACTVPLHQRLRHWSEQHPCWTIWALGILPLAFAATAMFTISTAPVFDVRLRVTPQGLQKMVVAVLPWAIGYWGVVLAVASIMDIIGSSRNDTPARQSAKAARSLWSSVICLAVLGTYVANIPSILVLDHGGMGQRLESQAPLLKSVAASASRWSLASSYGLFRRMTGVGDSGEGRRVARPEVEFFGSYDGSTWIPYSFSYKPGDVGRSPPWVAPHQPRLDWQMWFAALGGAHLSPWSVHLAKKLLEGSPAVMDLLGSDLNQAFRESLPQYVKADLYVYEFTRPSWGRERKGLDGLELAASDHNKSSDWWVRQRAEVYLHPVQKGQLESFLEHFGWSTSQQQELESRFPRPAHSLALASRITDILVSLAHSSRVHTMWTVSFLICCSIGCNVWSLLRGFVKHRQGHVQTRRGAGREKVKIA